MMTAQTPAEVRAAIQRGDTEDAITDMRGMAWRLADPVDKTHQALLSAIARHAADYNAALVEVDGSAGHALQYPPGYQDGQQALAYAALARALAEFTALYAMVHARFGGHADELF